MPRGPAGSAATCWPGLLIVVLRVVYRILFGGDYGDHVLVTLPEIPLPDWAVGVTPRWHHHARERPRGRL